MLNFKRAITLALFGAASAAQATAIEIELFLDDFSVAQGPISDLTVDSVDVRNNNGTRDIRTNLLAQVPPPSNTVEVFGGRFGVLDITNGTGDDSEVNIRWNVAARLVPTGATNVQFILRVRGSDANPTQVVAEMGGATLGSFDIPGNAFGRLPFAIDPAVFNTGGELHLAINGAPGWDLTLDSVGASFVPAQVPEPGTLALLGLGVLGMRFSRRRANV
jgi:PEP-CTERM motif